MKNKIDVMMKTDLLKDVARDQMIKQPYFFEKKDPLKRERHPFLKAILSELKIEDVV